MNEASLSQLYLKDTAFQNLMQKRVFNVMLIASPYDAFMMEEDGRVEEQIYFEYTSLNLSSPPRVSQVSDYATALERLAEKHYDLIIAMPGVDISETFANAKVIKGVYPETPFVVLTPFSREVSRRLANEDFGGVDYVFSWLGNVDLLLAIIKLLEDKLNADNDINSVGVQLILLVEDSVRFYSSILPTLYKFLLRQSRIFSTEALNEHEQMMRMRGRPKVMLARDYEEAMELYNRYEKNILGVISDVSFKRGGEKCAKAGIELAHELRARDPYLPIIIESSEEENEPLVKEFDGTFINKNSKKLPVDLGDAIMENFGFGHRDGRCGAEIGHIDSCVNTGIGAAAAGHMDIMAYNHGDGLLQGLLNGCQILLHLPAMIAGAFIGQDQSNIAHAYLTNRNGPAQIPLQSNQHRFPALQSQNRKIAAASSSYGHRRPGSSGIPWPLPVHPHGGTR